MRPLRGSPTKTSEFLQSHKTIGCPLQFIIDGMGILEKVSSESGVSGVDLSPSKSKIAPMLGRVIYSVFELSLCGDKVILLSSL